MVIELTLNPGDSEILIAALRDQASAKEKNGAAQDVEVLDRLRIDIEEQLG